MELPFKYIVLCIIRELKTRNMPLVIEKSNLVEYLTLLLNKAHLTMEEKKEIGSNFNFEYEVSELTTKYYYYFDVDDEKIIFDSDYAYELGTLILEEMKEYDIEFIHSIDFAYNDNTVTLLEILGVKIRKELYNYLLNIEKEIEEAYDELYRLECYVGFEEVDTSNIINKIKTLNMKKRVMLVNTKNLLPNTEYSDLIKYANNMVDKTTDTEDISFLLEDKKVDTSDIMYDSFLRSIFTNSDSYISNLWESLVINYHGMSKDIKYSMINFYLTFLELLDREIEDSNELLNIELIGVKYRLMNTMDSVYGTALFMNNKDNVISDKENKERYDFIKDIVYYFTKELLMYDDDKYRNNECGTDNVMIYLNNIMKKLLIEAYYKITNDKNIVSEIKNNNLYGTNLISSGLLKDIVDKPKTRIKDK